MVKSKRETIVRFEFSPLVAIFDANGLFDANKFLRAVQFFDAGIQQQINERSSTTIHDRDFWRIGFSLTNVIDTGATRATFRCSTVNPRIHARSPNKYRAQYHADLASAGKSTGRFKSVRR